MAIHKFDLLGDRATEETRPVQHICSTDVSQSNASWSITRKTLSTGISSGVEVVDVHNGRVNFTIIPTRGMGLWRAVADHRTLGWKSPIRGPVHPAYVPIAEPTGFGWLAGFDELMCRCGLVSNGAPEFNDAGQLVYPIHGRIANLPACEVTATIDDMPERSPSAASSKRQDSISKSCGCMLSTSRTLMPVPSPGTIESRILAGHPPTSKCYITRTSACRI